MKENGWADPTAIVLFLVGSVILGGLFPLLAGFVSMGAAPIIGCFLVTAGIVWVISMLIQLKNGDFFGGLLAGVFGVLFGLAPGTAFLLEFAAAGTEVMLDPRITGWYLIYVAVVFLILAFPAGKRIWSMMLIFLVVFIGAMLVGLVFAGFLPLPMVLVSAWLLFIAGLWFTYMAAAITIDTVFQKPILPVGGPLFK